MSARRRSRPSALAAGRVLALAAGLTLAAGACGYSTGLRASERLGSVAVTFFENDTYEPDVERSLQNELTRAMRSLTDLQLTAPDAADVLVRGRVTAFNRRGGIRSPDNDLLETGIYIEAEAALVDRRNDRVLGPAKRAGTWVGYTLDQPSNQVDAEGRALRSVAEKLVLELFAPVE